LQNAELAQQIGDCARVTGNPEIIRNFAALV